jgi:hypothetical protein
MKNTTRMVLVEDFDIDTVRKAFLQGCLYIQVATTSQENHREKGIQAILQYVARIHACASPTYASSIHQLWEQILRSPKLGDLFFLKRYNTSRGQPNWYRVNATVMVLLEHNVYRRDTYTAIQLHMLMEQTTKRTNHYSGMNRYLLEYEDIAALLQIIQQ